MEWSLFYSFLFLCLSFQEVYTTVYYPTVFWTPNNCRFNLNKANRIEKNKYFFKVRPNSHIFFMCPNIAIWRDASMRSPHVGRMYENLILVDKESYDSCSVRNISGRYHNIEILRCDERPDNMKIKYTHEIFSSFQAHKNKVQYTFGQDYYLISTSDGTLETLNGTSGGHCKTHNMKLHIYLCNTTEKCEFEMPKCPFNDPAHSDYPSTSENNITPTIKVTVAASSKRESFKWLTESSHMFIHVGAGLLIIILVVILTIVLCCKRKQSTGNKRKEDVEEDRPMTV